MSDSSLYLFEDFDYYVIVHSEDHIVLRFQPYGWMVIYYDLNNREYMNQFFEQD